MGRPWIKFSTGFFDDEKIKLILGMPDGKTIALIWVRLLCLAGKADNDGVFRLTQDIPYNDELFAELFDESPATVRMALQTFVKLGMMIKINDAYALPNWTKYQSEIDAIARAKQKNKERQQKWRDRQKHPLLETTNEKRNVTETLRNENGENNHFSQGEQQNVTLQRRYVTATDKELDKELEEELDIEGTTKNKNNCLSAAAAAFNNNFSKTEVITRDHSKQSPVGVKTVDFYNKNVFPLSSSYERERLLDLADEYGDEWCIAACKEAIDHQARSIAYIDKVLRTWRAKGYKKIPDKKSAPVLDDQYNDIPF